MGSSPEPRVLAPSGWGRKWRDGRGQREVVAGRQTLLQRSTKILRKIGRYMRTFRYRPELNQPPSTASFGCLYPYMLCTVLRPDICRICACLHTGLAVTCLQVEVVSGFRKVSAMHKLEVRMTNLCHGQTATTPVSHSSISACDISAPMCGQLASMT